MGKKKTWYSIQYKLQIKYEQKFQKVETMNLSPNKHEVLHEFCYPCL